MGTAPKNDMVFFGQKNSAPQLAGIGWLGVLLSRFVRLPAGALGRHMSNDDILVALVGVGACVVFVGGRLCLGLSLLWRFWRIAQLPLLTLSRLRAAPWYIEPDAWSAVDCLSDSGGRCASVLLLHLRSSLRRSGSLAGACMGVALRLRVLREVVGCGGRPKLVDVLWCVCLVYVATAWDPCALWLPRIAPFRCVPGVFFIEVCGVGRRRLVIVCALCVSDFALEPSAFFVV